MTPELAREMLVAAGMPRADVEALSDDNAIARANALLGPTPDVNPAALDVYNRYMATQQESQAAPAPQAGEENLVITGPSEAVNRRTGTVYTWYPGDEYTPAGWEPTGESLEKWQYQALFGEPASGAGAAAGGGGGGAVYRPSYDLFDDPTTGTKVYFDPVTRQRVDTGIPIASPQVILGDVLYEKQPDGTYKAVAGVEPEPWQYVSRDEGIWAINPETQEVKEIVRFPQTMSEAERQSLELQRQQLALQAEEAGFPNVAYSYGGRQYRQVSPGRQIAEGGMPQVAFEERPAEEGAAWEPSPAPTPEEVGPLELGRGRMTEGRARGIASVFARGGYRTSPFWRLGAGLGGFGRMTVAQRAALRQANEGAPVLAGERRTSKRTKPPEETPTSREVLVRSARKKARRELESRRKRRLAIA